MNLMVPVVHLPLLKVSVQDSTGEALPANSDALQHTVTAQLVNDKVIVHNPYCYFNGQIEEDQNKL